MTNEEKAKAYDEALERARKQRDDYQKELNKADKNSQLAGLLRAGISAIELAFPQLAESEDERIRKELKEAFEAYDIESTWNGIPIRSIFAWLEKQKEPKPAWSEEDERILRTIISDGSRGVELDSKQISWLKSLRPSWKPSEQEKGALRTAISVLTEERSFPKAAAHLQAILDAFDGKEARKDWKPSEEQINALKDIAYGSYQNEDGPVLRELYEQLKKLM